MSEQTTVVSDDSANVSDVSEETVSYKAHAKLLAQRKADQVKLQDAITRLAEYESERKADQESKLKEQNKWQEVAESKDAELLEAKKQLKSIETSIVRAEKVNAFEKAFGAQLKHQDFTNHINTDAITVDDSGEINAESLNAEVNRFRGAFGDSLTITNDMAKVPTGAPSGGEKPTLATMSSAQRAELRRSLTK